DAVPGADGHRVFVAGPSELVLLWIAAGVQPPHPRERRRREALERRVVAIRDHVLIGSGDSLEADQVRVAIHSEAQAAGEDAHRQARKRHLETRPVGPDRTARRAERRCGATDLLGTPWQAR